MNLLRSAFLSLALTVASAPASAQSAPELLQAHLYEGRIAEADRLFSARPVTDIEAQAALGMTRFVAAIERLGQGLYRHGLQAPRNMMMPGINFPVPVNPKPEPITYETFRELLAAFVRDLDAAQKTLEGVGDAQIKLPVDVLKLRIDINGDGKADESEKFVSLFMGMVGGPRASNEPVDVGTFPIAFDTADMYWLRGYSNLLAVVPEFFLAHDFRDAFEATFHLFFPSAQTAFAGIERERAKQSQFGDTGSMADVMALIHLMRWKTIEPERRVSLHQRLKTVVSLNRKTWAAAQAETDDDREWLPSPTQKGVLAGVPVTRETITSWLAVIDTAEKVLDGQLLVPHWQLNKGFNLKKMLTEGKEFDLVLAITGHGMLPYIEAGPVADARLWQQASRGLRGNLLMYAFYFN